MASKTEDVRDFTGYADKEPTGTMKAFADFLIDEVYGGEFPGTAKDEKAFRNGVRLGGTLRMEFQASEYWKTHEDNPRGANGKAAKPAPAKPRGKAAAAKDEDAEDEAPAKATKRGTTAKPAAAKGKPVAAKPGARRTGRRGAAAAASNDAEAPY
jgi:hypothetical protein